MARANSAVWMWSRPAAMAASAEGRGVVACIAMRPLKVAVAADSRSKTHSETV